MSRTVSRGVHSIGRWSSVTIALIEHLEGRERAQAGIFPAIDRYFDWVQDGILTGMGKPGNPKIPQMAGTCALSYTYGIFKALGKDTEPVTIGSKIRRFKSLVRLSQKQPVRYLRRDPAFKELLQFLKEFHRQAEANHDAHVMGHFDDEDD